jgi:pyruvate/2-oxoglutarate dehydrogenase complex dihydrolipoamide dehydrogenase (E3) component
MTTTRPKRFDRNLVVIGGGAAGLVSAIVGVKAGAAVTLVEAGEMGGDCLNTGCVPSKALLHVASLVHGARDAARLGLLPDAGAVNSAAAMAYVQRAIGQVAPHDSVARFAGMGVDVRRGYARITSPWSVEIDGTALTTRSIIVATGAAPVVPDIPGLGDYLTSETIWALPEAPGRLLILGGGPIACELAQAFARLGSNVTIADTGERLLAREDDDVSAHMRARLVSEGVTVLSGHRAVAASGTEMMFEHGARVPYDRVLVAIGRKARVAGFGLEQLGVKLGPSGTVQTNRYLQSSCPSLYACGDVAGPYQFTHAASHQAWHATINALFGQLHQIPVDYGGMPAVTYCDPEIARVGLNEREAKARGVSYEVITKPIDDLDRAIVDEAHGFVKILTKPGSDRILGATVVAPRAGEMLAELTLAMRHGIGLKKLFATIHPYPTYTEANRDTAGAWRQAHAPAWVFPLLGRYQSWLRG